MSKVLTEIKGPLLTVTLNRPEIKNVMDAETISEIKKAFSLVNNSISVVILKGAGDFFCAGGDLNWMKSSLQKSKKENEEDALALAKMLRAVDECPAPVITHVKGGAFGGGVGLVAASDIVLADEKALFSLSEVKLGLIPATIGPIVMRKIGMSEARRLYLTGKRFSSVEAKAMHLVHEVLPVSSFHSVTRDYLKEFESAGPEAVRRAKLLIREMQSGLIWQPDVSEVTSKVLSEVRVGAEAQEGMLAFLEKRKPKWRQQLVEGS